MRISELLLYDMFIFRDELFVLKEAHPCIARRIGFISNGQWCGALVIQERQFSSDELVIKATIQPA